MVPAWRPAWINCLLGVLAHTQRESVRGLSEGRGQKRALLRVRSLNTLANGAPMANKKIPFRTCPIGCWERLHFARGARGYGEQTGAQAGRDVLGPTMPGDRSMMRER